jgi:predicted nuclease of predicted toxin-antitoxin system
MRFLLDMPVSMRLPEVIESYDHTGVHASQIGRDRASDSDLLQLAALEGRVIITADLDFPRLLALSMAAGPGLILFRGGSYSDAEMCRLLASVLETVPVATIEKSICVVDSQRVRVTPLPLGS